MPGPEPDLMPGLALMAAAEPGLMRGTALTRAPEPGRTQGMQLTPEAPPSSREDAGPPAAGLPGHRASSSLLG